MSLADHLLIIKKITYLLGRPLWNCMTYRRSGGDTKEHLCIEAQERGKNVALIIKSSLCEGIFIDAKGVNCASSETVLTKEIFFITISEDLLEHKHHPVSEFIGHHIRKQNDVSALNSFKSFYKSN